MKKAPNGQFLLGALALSCAALFTACQNTSMRTTAELQRLQGTWEGVMVGQEKNGNITITITSNSLHFHRDTNFWFETTFTQPVGTHLKQLHATIKDCAPGQENSVGKVVVAIYKIEDETLTLAYNQDPEGPLPNAFPSDPNSPFIRLDLKKVRPQKRIPPPKNLNEPKTP